MTTLALVYVYMALMVYTYVQSVEMAGRDEFNLHIIPGIVGAMFMPVVLPLILLYHLYVWAAGKLAPAKRQARVS